MKVLYRILSLSVLSAALLTADVTLQYEELLFIAWGDGDDKLSMAELPGGRVGPSAFRVQGAELWILDALQGRLKLFSHDRLIRSERSPRFAEDFLPVEEGLNWFLSGNRALFTEDGRVSRSIPAQDGRSMITGLHPVPGREHDVRLEINHSRTFQSERKTSTPDDGLPYGDQGRMIQVSRVSNSLGRVTLNSSESMDLHFKDLALLRYIGKGPGETVYLYVETFDEKNQLEVQRFLQLYSLQGQRLANVLLPSASFTRIHREFYCDPQGHLYHMLSTPEGIYIVKWTAASGADKDPVQADSDSSMNPDSRMPLSYPEKFRHGRHFNDELPILDGPADKELQPEMDSKDSDAAAEGSPASTPVLSSDPPEGIMSVTPDQAIAIAETYIDHVWTARDVNIAAPGTTDSNGKPVESPYWVQVGSNSIFPYRWGGFETLEQFDAGLLDGRYAGDVATSAVSYAAVGVDCSGYVSRCWRLSSHYSTSMMSTYTGMFRFYDSWDDLKPGDAIHKVGHVRLNIGRNEDGSFLVLESTGSGWRVKYSSYTLADLSSYRPMYYTGMSGSVSQLPSVRMDMAMSSGDSLIFSWTRGLSSGEFGGFELMSSSNNSQYSSTGSALLAPDQSRHSLLSTAAGGSCFYIRSVSEDASSSGMPSDSYAARTGSDPILIVDGFDRIASYQKPYHDFAARLALMLSGSGAAIHTVDNGSLADLPDALFPYRAVFWILGDESTADETFSSSEQTLVRNYLADGGQLFVSGSELAWDLDYRGYTADQDFIRNVLKTKYLRDDAGVYSVNGRSGSPFSGLSIQFDDGSGPTYEEDYPDVFSPVNGGESALLYSDGSTAAVSYTGSFPGGSSEGRIFVMGFPFETITDAGAQVALIAAVADYFGIDGVTSLTEAPVQLPAELTLLPNFPNPFNSSTTLHFHLPREERVTLQVYNSLGQQTRSLDLGLLPAGYRQLDLQMPSAASGIYFYTLQTRSRQTRGKFALMK